MKFLLAFSFVFFLISGSASATAQEENCVDVLAVVDGFFLTGKEIVDVAKGKGFLGAAILSSEKFPPGGEETLGLARYLFRVIHHGDLDASLAELDQQFAAYRRETGLTPRLAGAMAGTDLGIFLQDELNHRRGTPGNPIASSRDRVDKTSTGQALRRAGVRFLHEKSVGSFEEASTWAREFWESKGRPAPIMVKPPMSNGGDRAAICADLDDLAHAFAAIHRRTNKNHRPNESVLLQEYVSGPQYAVNTVSYQIESPSGEPRQVRLVTDIWHQVRGGPFPSYVYDHNLLISTQGKLPQTLALYNRAVLDAVDFRVGASHLEMILTDEGPVAIDLNSRLAGAGMPMLAEKATGLDSVGLAIDAHVGRLSLTEIAPYELTRYAAVVYIRSHGGSQMSHRLVPALDRMKRDGHILSYRLNFAEGAALSTSRDTDSIVAKFEILDGDKERMHRTIAELKEFERRRSFEE